MYRDTSCINEYKVIACFDYLCMVDTKELFVSSEPSQHCPLTFHSGKPYSSGCGCSWWLCSSHYMLSKARQPWSTANAAMKWLMTTFTLGWAHTETPGINLQGIFYQVLILWLAELSQVILLSFATQAYAYWSCHHCLTNLVWQLSAKFSGKWNLLFKWVNVPPEARNLGPTPPEKNLLNSSDHTHGILLKTSCLVSIWSHELDGKEHIPRW